jgi:hypothetical protein
MPPWKLSSDAVKMIFRRRVSACLADFAGQDELAGDFDVQDAVPVEL